MGRKEYTLDELVKRTGFSKRQIRYYITEKLVPGAGDQLGPYAAYGPETLNRLELIKKLKSQKVGPTGRTLTLAEIGHALGGLPDPETPLMVCEPRNNGFPIHFDGKMGYPPEPESSASSYLDSIEGEGPSSNEVLFSFGSPMAASIEAPDIPDFNDPGDSGLLEELLQSLHSLLTGLGSDTRFDSQVGEGESWRRITTPDVEIQVRTPDTMEALGRLKRMAAQLGRLLARED